MRNVLIFPNGDEQEFMYPTDREIEIGTELVVTMDNGSIQSLRVVEIMTERKRMTFKLAY